jgi:aminopeptidase N
MRIARSILLLLLLCAGLQARANPAVCSNTAARYWWKAHFYDLSVRFDTGSAYIEGDVRLHARVADHPVDSLQIDLAEGLQITGLQLLVDGQRMNIAPGRIHRTGAQYYIRGDFSGWQSGQSFVLVISYKGALKESVNPPWTEGLIRQRDPSGNAWMAMTCQSAGAATWFPCKNYQAEEPDSVQLQFWVPPGFTAIGNGRLQYKDQVAGMQLWEWKVSSPVNLYNLTYYIGDYIHWSDTLQGLNGLLPLDYYVLRPDEARAKKHFASVKPVLHCFESRLGPYPFYPDGYKLVAAPYLGMEHQSAVAYGNQYQNGYLGKDRSGTGIGLQFDFIIVHETGHEWFGNSITAADKADTWLHEGFTTYTETLYAECLLGKEAAFKYQAGKRHRVLNDRPVQGAPEACDEGSPDHYDKAGFVVHMIRLLIDDDAVFFDLLRNLNSRYFHRIVSSDEVEQYISGFSGKDFKPLFDQYLRQPGLPVLEWKPSATQGIAYRWSECVPGFNMPVRLADGAWLYPDTDWKYRPERLPAVDEGFLINISQK